MKTLKVNNLEILPLPSKGDAEQSEVAMVTQFFLFCNARLCIIGSNF
jgi:hypothetical protein